jgi:hypothetical protein
MVSRVGRRMDGRRLVAMFDLRSPTSNEPDTQNWSTWPNRRLGSSDLIEA